MKRLLAWSRETWADMEGRMWRDSVDVDDVLDEPCFVLVGLLFSYVIDDTVNGDRSRLESRAIASFIAEHGRPPESVEQALNGEDVDPAVQQEGPDRDTWGLLPEHQAGLAAAAGVLGGDASAATSDGGDLSMWEAPLRE